MRIKRSPILIFCTVGCHIALCAAQVIQSNGRKNYPPLQEFHPGANGSVTFQDEIGTARLVKVQNHLLIESTWDHATFRTPLPEELGQVDQIARGIGKKIVVRGMVNGSGSEVLVIDRGGKMEDKFLCYLPAISPDGHYVAFIRFYPAHFASGTTDRYMLYNLSKSAEGNRSKGLSSKVSATEWINVGEEVFPAGEANAYGRSSGVALSTTHYSASALFWAKSSKEFVFLDRTGESYQLVTLVLSAEAGVRVAKIAVNTAAMCPLEAAANGQVELCRVLMREAKFGTGGDVSSAELQVVPDRSYILSVSADAFIKP